MTCSQTGGMIVGEEGVKRWEWCQGAWQGVEASGAAEGPEGVSGYNWPLGEVDMVWCGS